MTIPFLVTRLSPLICLLTLIASCGQDSEEVTNAVNNDVDFISIYTDTASVQLQYPALIEGSDNVAIKTQATGYLEKIYVKEGDYVQKGQPLFKIKDDIYTEQVRNARATYQAATAEVKNASIEIDKIRPLVAGKVFSEPQLQSAEAKLAVAKAQLAQTRSALQSTELNAAFTLIKSPVSGYTGRIPNRIGNLINPSEPEPLTTVSDINKLFVYFSLVEADFMTFMKDKSAQRVKLIMADGSVYSHQGTIEFASGNIDRNTGSISLKAIFPNPDKLLRAGGSGRIVIEKAYHGIITIPMESVKDIQDKFFVYLLGKGNKVSMLPVKITGISGNSYIVSSGLKPGDRIAINRIDALNDGMLVIPKYLKTSFARKTAINP